MNKKLLIVHVGMGKTGTTSFQKHIFPKLCKSKSFVYNPAEFITIQSQDLKYSDQQKKDLNVTLSSNNTLISYVSLLGWHPKVWATCADKVLDLFGRDAKIIITLRDPVDYLRALYVQIVKTNQIIYPSEFFMGFDHKSFDYERLKKLYTDRFSEVYIVPTSQYGYFFPWGSLFNLTDKELFYFKSLVKKILLRNKSYSNLTMKLTYARESVFQFFNFSSQNIKDINIPGFEALNRPFYSMSVAEKIIFLIPKIIQKLLTWQLWMSIIDRCNPFYSKYNLPKDIIFDAELMNKNRKFLRNHEDQISKSI